MKKRVIAFLLMLCIAVSTCSLSVFAAGLGEGGSFRGGGAGRIDVPKRYYPSAGADDNVYDSGTPSVEPWSVVDSTLNQVNFILNNVRQTINFVTYEYDVTNNYYSFITETNVEYKIYNNYTNVIITGPEPADPNSMFSVQMYYALPDGRNSRELTAADVWGEYFIYDYVNYDGVLEDDGVTIGLYHFDGNLRNSSAGSGMTFYISSERYINGKFGQGVSIISTATSFDDAEAVTIDLKLHDALSVEFWLYASSVGYGEKRETASDTDLGFKWTKTYESSLFYPSFADSSWINISTDKWSHILLTRESVDSETWSLYIDGSQNYFTPTVEIPNDLLVISNNCDLPIFAKHHKFFHDFIAIDELLVKSTAYEGGSSFIPREQPYDENIVYVLPANGMENQIAIKSGITVSESRVGGVRPTYPVNGYVYVMLDEDIVVSVQQYQNDGWYSVGASIYVNGVWEDLLGYDMSLYGNSDNFDDVTIPTPTPAPTDPPDSGDDSGSSSDSSGGFFDGLINTLLGGLMDLLGLVLETLLQIITVLLGWVARFTAFVLSYCPWLPPGVVTVITVGVPLAFILGIIKFIRG